MGHVTFGVYENAEGRTRCSRSATRQRTCRSTPIGRDKTHCVLASTLEGQRRFNTGNFTATLVNATVPPRRDAAALATGREARRKWRRRRASAAHRFYFMSEHLPNLDSRITLLPRSRRSAGHAARVSRLDLFRARSR